MAEKTFGETLTKIRGYALDTGVEEATKQGVILPLLNRVGWDTEDVSEVCPEYPVASVGKVDYALRIGKTNSVFVEAKSWGGSLGDGEERQLENYVLASNPRPALGVLTNGRLWYLYLPPGPGRPGKNQKIRLFLEFDITAPPHELEALGENFNRFLSRGSVSNAQAANQTRAAARALLRDKQSQGTANNAIASGLEQIGRDTPELIDFLAKLAEKQGVQPTPEQIQVFIDAWKVGITFDSPDSDNGGKNPRAKPASFTFQADGKAVVETFRGRRESWNDLLTRLCTLMHELHPDKFRAVLLAMPESFTDSAPAPGEDWPKPIGETGIYAHYGNMNAIKHRCAALLGKFDYPATALTIKLKNGAEIPL